MYTKIVKYSFLGIFILAAILAFGAIINKGIFAEIEDKYVWGLYSLVIVQVVGGIIYYFRKEVLNPKIQDHFLPIEQVKDENIWKGFIKDFKSYNDSWLIEWTDNVDRFVPVHRERYNNKEAKKFKFLFFIRNNEKKKSWKSFIRFVEFQMLVHFELNQSKFEKLKKEDGLKLFVEDKLKKGISALGKIQVFIAFKEPSPHTFFRGYKKTNGEKTTFSIWYLSADLKFLEDGIPKIILTTQDKNIWNHLDEIWDSASEGADKMIGEEIFRKYFEVI